MSFNILYIENDINDVEKVEKAINKFNEESGFEILSLNSINTPDSLYKILNRSYDLVIADVYYDNPSTGVLDDIPRLDEIINIVNKWSKDMLLGRPIPIIAFTGKGKNVLKKCLENKDHLYDIWAKNAASPSYIAWKLSQLSQEFSRIRPDALMQRLIQEMPNGASWHSHVIEMVSRYNQGWTENDQVHGAGQHIENIFHELKIYDYCNDYWQIIMQWESLGRSVSRRTRGHARHVINVFWLGYYLIHHPCMKEYFINAWKHLIHKRSDMGIVSELDPLEAMSNCWLLAAIFHDAANCLEKYPNVLNFSENILLKFDAIANTKNINDSKKRREEENIYDWIDPSLIEQAQKFWMIFDESIREAFLPLWEKSLAKGKPDHGVLSAIQLIHILKNDQFTCFAKEAARAISLHNLVGALKPKQENLISWRDEPLASLLIFCDQIQTWDRERSDKKLDDKVEPERAELTELNIQNIDNHIQINMSINYIGPKYLEYEPVTYLRVKDDLENILKVKPNRAMSKISQPWPFSLNINCFLSGNPLAIPLRF